MHSIEHKTHLARPAEAVPARTVWLLTWLVESCVFAFSALVVAAICVYPGGTFWDRATQGHSFWQNFLCDLVQSPALGGGANALGARLATWGMFALVAGMVAFVGIVPSLLTDARRMTRQVKMVVVAACAMIVCVPLLPSDRYGALHAAAIFAAGIPVSIALIVLVATLVRQAELAGWLRTLSLALCVMVSASLALYAAEVLFGAPPLRIVPTLSRLSNLGLIVWLVGLSRVARARTAPALNPRG